MQKKIQYKKIKKLYMSNITIYVIDRVGKKHSLVAPTDMNMNIMELCKSYDLPIEGICGGMAMCASCQIYVHDDVFFGKRNKEEEAMLAEANYVKNNSRLSCQIPITENLNGMVIELAKEI